MPIRVYRRTTFIPGGFYGAPPLPQFPFPCILVHFRDDAGKLHRRVVNVVTTDDTTVWPDEIPWSRIQEWTPVDVDVD